MIFAFWFLYIMGAVQTYQALDGMFFTKFIRIGMTITWPLISIGYVFLLILFKLFNFDQ